MNESLQLRLAKEFEGLYQDGDATYGFPFECGDGWYDIIHDLSQQLVQVAAWSGIHIYAVQVKEKFGTLRFYFDMELPSKYIPDEVVSTTWKIADSCVRAAENKTYHTCEVCGSDGKMNAEGYWKSVRCSNHGGEP